MKQINSRFENASGIFLICLVFVSTIYWLPLITPTLIRYINVLFITLFITSVIVLVILKGQISLTRSHVMWLPLLLVPVYIGTLGPETVILYFGFFIAIISYFHIGPTRQILHKILVIFSTSIAYQSIYALITTFTPVPYISTQYVRIIGNAPVSLYAFSGGRIYILLSISIIISTYLFFRYDSWYKWVFFTFALVTVTHLLIFISFTGTGRTGLALVFASVLFGTMYLFDMKRLIPLLTISPIALWVSLFIFYTIFPDMISTDIFSSVNDFTSNRLLLYIGGIEIVVENMILIDSGGYTLSQIFPLSYPASIPQTTHNILINTLVDKGIAIATIFSLWFWKIGKISSASRVNRQNRDILLSSTIVTAYIFVGLFVGGAIIFNINHSSLWWVMLAYITVWNVDD